jgi:hypothetical protein
MSMPVPEKPPRVNKWFLLAGAVNIAGMLLVISGIVRLTPTTMMLSVGGGGMLLAIAMLIYVINVAYDLRRRNLL